MGKKSKLKKARKLVLLQRQKDEEVQKEEESSVSTVDQERASLYTAIKPPYKVILDTNFINDSIRRKLNLEEALSECLDANVELFVPECVIAELEKLGRIYRVAITTIKNLRVTELKCLHKGTYADNCILDRVTEFKCYIVATSDTNLRQRIKKKTGVPIVFFRGHKCVVERFAPGL